MAIITPRGHTLGLTLAHPDPRNWPYALSAAGPPPDISWRHRMQPVGNQGNLRSCTGWGGTAAVEALRQDGLQRSPLYVYYRDRAEDGTLATSDTGATLLGLSKALKDYGAPPEAVWPYIESRYSYKPSDAADAAAAQCRIESFRQIPGTGMQLLQGIWAALQEGPFPITLKVFPSYEHPDSQGRVRMPTSSEAMLGGHLVCATGWINDNSAPGGYGWIDQQGSWGDQLGDGGYWRLPAAYVLYGIVQEAHVYQLAAAPAPENTMDTQGIIDRLVEARRVLDVARYQTRATDINAAFNQLGSVSDYLGQALDLLPKVEPVPVAVPFVSPLPNGAIYGRTKWLPGSKGCDLFCKRGTILVAPADCLALEVLGGYGMTGGDELILSLSDKSWAWRYRHSRATVRVGDHVQQGQPVAVVEDSSLDQLGRIPLWASTAAGQPFPDGWQHLDLSVNRGTDQFSPQGGGGGNVDAYQWLHSLGYQGTVLARTPGPPDAGLGMAASIRFMTPGEHR